MAVEDDWQKSDRAEIARTPARQGCRRPTTGAGPPPAAPIAGQVLGIRPEIVGAELGKMAAKAGWGLGECQGTRVIYRHALRSSGDAETHASQEVALQPRRMTKAERVGLQVHGYSVS